MHKHLPEVLGGAHSTERFHGLFVVVVLRCRRAEPDHPRVLERPGRAGVERF